MSGCDCNAFARLAVCQEAKTQNQHRPSRRFRYSRSKWLRIKIEKAYVTGRPASCLGDCTTIQSIHSRQLAEEVVSSN
jgi:hypothetical protein